jgi:hypothetical protein
MVEIYTHEFGNESSQILLQAYGIIPANEYENDTLKPRHCPNCNEPNKPDSRFCAKCKMVLTFDAYSETLELEQNKERKIEDLTRRQEQFEKFIQSLIDSGQLKPTVTH